MKLRKYQKEISDKAVNILKDYRFVYLAMEVRTGKTFTSLSVCQQLKVDNILFITKKKAISSISDDEMKLNECWNFWCINYESLHKLPDIKWDVVICDEAHSLGAFPRPSKRGPKTQKGLDFNPK